MIELFKNFTFMLNFGETTATARGYRADTLSIAFDHNNASKSSKITKLIQKFGIFSYPKSYKFENVRKIKTPISQKIFWEMNKDMQLEYIEFDDKIGLPLEIYPPTYLKFNISLYFIQNGDEKNIMDSIKGLLNQNPQLILEITSDINKRLLQFLELVLKYNVMRLILRKDYKGSHRK